MQENTKAMWNNKEWKKTLQGITSDPQEEIFAKKFHNIAFSFASHQTEFTKLCWSFLDFTKVNNFTCFEL